MLTDFCINIQNLKVSSRRKKQFHSPFKLLKIKALLITSYQINHYFNLVVLSLGFLICTTTQFRLVCRLRIVLQFYLFNETQLCLNDSVFFKQNMNDLEHVHITKYFIVMALLDLIAAFETR